MEKTTIFELFNEKDINVCDVDLKKTTSGYTITILSDPQDDIYGLNGIKKGKKVYLRVDNKCNHCTRIYDNYLVVYFNRCGSPSTIEKKRDRILYKRN